MIFDDVDFDLLPSSSEEAFVVYEKQIRKKYKEFYPHDRSASENQGLDGYNGNYEPERSYMNAILAFVDEYRLEIDIPDISNIQGYAYYNEFIKVKSTIEYAIGRFVLRKNRINTGTAGTVITISSTYKVEICTLLGTIRKIVNQEVSDVKKRDNIFSKIASLQSEVDRDQTTIDAIFGHMIDFSKAVGTCAEELEPLLNKIERIKKILWNSPQKVDLLPKKECQKLISDKPEEPDIDDEIPF